MTDEALEKAVAKLTISYWEEVTKEAARRHPNWELLPDGHLKWLGGRTGPRTPRTLMNWYITNFPDECEQIAQRIRAKATFGGDFGLGAGLH